LWATVFSEILERLLDWRGSFSIHFLHPFWDGIRQRCLGQFANL